jgi:Zn-dependent alcohol dehydrogenase
LALKKKWKKIRNCKKKQKICLIGVGGVGMAALLALLKKKSEIYIIENNKFKINFLKKFDVNFLSSKSDLKKYINYFNYCIETSGSTKMIQLGLSLIKSNGKIIFASHPAKSERIRINPHDLIQGKKIYGSWGGCCKPDRDIKKIFKFFNDKNIFSQNLKIKKYRLNEVSLAFKDILKGKSHRAVIKF